VKAFLPNGTKEILKFSIKSTIEQVKNKYVNDFFPPKFKKQNWFIIFNGTDVLEYEFNKFADPPAHPNIIKAWEDNLPIEINFIPDLDLKKLKSGTITSYSYAGTTAAPKEAPHPVAKATQTATVASPTAVPTEPAKKNSCIYSFSRSRKGKRRSYEKERRGIS